MFKAIGPLGWCAGAAWFGAALGGRLEVSDCLALVAVAVGALTLALRGSDRRRQLFCCLSISTSVAALAVDEPTTTNRPGARVYGVVERIEEFPQRWELVVREPSTDRRALRIPRGWSRNAVEEFPEGLGRGALIEVPVREDGMVDALAQVELLQASPGSRFDSKLRSARRHWRERVWQRAASNERGSGATAGLLLALIAGDGSQLSQSDRIDLRASGLMHLVVASGAQVGLLALVTGFLVAPWFGPAHRVRIALILVTALVSALLLPDQAPVRRASVALLGVVAARLAGRGLAGRHALSLAVLWLAVSAPACMATPSLVLSVVATAAIVWSGRAQTRWRRSLIQLIAPSLVTWHLLSLLSGRLALWGVVANLGAAIPATLALISGWLAASLPSALHHPAAWCASLAANLLREWSAWVAELPGSGCWLEPPPVLLAGIGIGCGFGVLLCTGSKWRSGCAALWLALVWHSARFNPGASGLEESVAVLDVGQGSAAVFATGAGAVMVDVGPFSSRGASAPEIVDELRRLQLRRLEALFLTHADRDHVGGALDLLSMVSVGRIFVPPGALDAPRLSELIRYAARKRVPVETLSAGQRVRLAGIELTCLHPASWDLRDHNDASLVLAVRGKRHTTLVMGDVSGSIERALRENWRIPDDAAAFYVVAHHGSKSSSDLSWLEAIRPRVAIVSAGRGNRHRHPDHQVVERLLRTAGTLRITANHRSVRYARFAPEPGSVETSIGEWNHERMRHEAQQQDQQRQDREPNPSRTQ
jgi:competence protein ComEC